MIFQSFATLEAPNDIARAVGAVRLDDNDFFGDADLLGEDCLDDVGDVARLVEHRENDAELLFGGRHFVAPKQSFFDPVGTVS